MIEASFVLFGRSVVAARLPSALQAAALVLIVGLAVARVSTTRAASLSAMVVASSIGVQIFARVAHPEIAVVFAVTSAELLLAMYVVARRPSDRFRLALLVGSAMGYGVLAKGPVAIVLPMLAGSVALLVSRASIAKPLRSDLQLTRNGCIALGTELAIASPWYIGMTLRHGRAFLDEALWAHNIGRYAGTMFKHRSSVFGLVLPALLAMMPWTAFVPRAFREASRIDQSPTGVLRLLMASAAVTSFLFYSASASKLPHYALVVLPALAVLVGISLDERLRSDERATRESWFTAVALTGGGIGLATLPWLINHLFRAREVLGGAPGDGSVIRPALELAFWPAALFLVVAAIVLMRQGIRARVVTLATVGAAAPLLLVAAAQPLLRAVYPWERFAQEIRVTKIPVWMIGPRAPSLTFYASRPVTRISEGELPTAALPPEAWIVADTNALGRSTPLLPTERITIVDRFGTMSLARVSSLQACR